jgi:hypothetical protein
LSDDSNGDSWWAPVIHFLTHSVVGTAIFVIIALPAWGLEQVVGILKEHHMEGYPATVLTLLANAIVSLDAFLVFAYFYYAAKKALKEWQ